MLKSLTSEQAAALSISDDAMFETLRRVGFVLNLPVERSDLDPDEPPAHDANPGDDSSGPVNSSLARLEASASRAGILVRETPSLQADEVRTFIAEGFPVILLLSNPDSLRGITTIPDDYGTPDPETETRIDAEVPPATETEQETKAEQQDRLVEPGRIIVLERIAGRGVEAVDIGDQTKSRVLSMRDIKRLFREQPTPRKLLCKKELACEALSSAADHSHNGHSHPRPMRRFAALLKLDSTDILTVVVFAFVAGILSMATPLAVESLVNVVSWGTYLQPLVVLGLILLTCLGLAGFLGVLQAVVVELIQRRQFVRIVGDLAHRFPRANQAALVGEYPRELANRVFDIMTIQKSSAVLLLDGVSIVLTTIIGMVLLAFYHPFLLGFDLVLLLSMISITWVLGRGGIRTSIDESITKYRVAHWLQDVLASPGVFKTGGGESLSIERSNQLTADYLNARQRQFRVVIRQVSFAIALEVLASTSLLALGGWLVIDGQLTLGQLVASEMVVTLVVGAFAKAGKSLEKFYDLMAGIDKVGHLIDIPADPRHEKYIRSKGPGPVTWTRLVYSHASSESSVDASSIEPGARVAIVGDDVDGRSLLARTLAGLATPSSGRVQVDGLDPSHALPSAAGQLVGYVGANDLFHGSLRDNIDLGRIGISQTKVRKAADDAGLADAILMLDDGLETHLQTGGYPLSQTQSLLVILARAIVTQPKLLVIDGLLDHLSYQQREEIWSRLTAADAPWTLIVNTNRDDVASLCDVQFSVRKS